MDALPVTLAAPALLGKGFPENPGLGWTTGEHPASIAFLDEEEPFSLHHARP